MQIKSVDVNKLRKDTGAGMMSCKEALVEAKGNFEKAIEILRKKGQKIADNRADRASSEGVVLSTTNKENTKGVIISLNCETDFVAKNDAYFKLANKIAHISINYNSKEDFLNAKYENKMTINEKLIEQTGIIGEKIEIGTFKTLSAPFVSFYIHMGNKIASLVGLSISVENANEVAKNVAMQVAAMNPIALNEENVDASIIKKEIEIAKDLLRKEGKPENILDNIVKGKIKKFYKENTLLNQSYIKDNKQTVSQYIQSMADGLTVTSYVRVALK